MLQEPWGYCWHLSTRRVETTLLAWFDEWLPIANRHLGEHDVPPALINIHPLFDECPKNPDWLTDSRAISQMIPFRAKTGMEGLEELAQLRQKLEREISSLRLRSTGKSTPLCPCSA